MLAGILPSVPAPSAGSLAPAAAPPPRDTSVPGRMAQPAAEEACGCAAAAPADDGEEMNGRKVALITGITGQVTAGAPLVLGGRGAGKDPPRGALGQPWLGPGWESGGGGLGWVCPEPSLPGPGARPRGCLPSPMPASLPRWSRQFLGLPLAAPGWVRGGQTSSWVGLVCPGVWRAPQLG